MRTAVMIAVLTKQVKDQEFYQCIWELWLTIKKMVFYDDSEHIAVFSNWTTFISIYEDCATMAILTKQLKNQGFISV